MKKGNGVNADHLWRTLSEPTKPDESERVIDELRGSQLAYRLAVKYTIRAMKRREARRLSRAIDDVLTEMRPRLIRPVEEDGPRVRLRNEVFVETLEEVIVRLRER